MATIVIAAIAGVAVLAVIIAAVDVSKNNAKYRAQCLVAQREEAERARRAFKK